MKTQNLKFGEAVKTFGTISWYATLYFFKTR